MTESIPKIKEFQKRNFEYLKETTEKSINLLKKLKKNIYWIIGLFIIFELVKALILYHLVCR